MAHRRAPRATDRRLLGVVALASLLLTALWLALLIWSILERGTPQTFAEALAWAGAADSLFYLTYLNATLITLLTTALFAGLYAYTRPMAPTWSAMGFAFLPAYSALNLCVYLSQVTIVPHLLAFQALPEYQASASLLLGQMVQQWPGSALAVLNSLAYGALSIPSIIFGVVWLAGDGRLRLAGGLLALSGIASIAGMIGLLAGNDALAMGSVVGGAIYLLALIPLSLAFLRSSAQASRKTM